MQEHEYTAGDGKKVYVRNELVTMIALEPDGTVVLTTQEGPDAAPEELRISFDDTDAAESWIRQNFADRLLDES